MRYKCVSCVCPVPAPADGVLGATYDLAFSGLSLPVLPMLHLCFLRLARVVTLEHP